MSDFCDNASSIYVTARRLARQLRAGDRQAPAVTLDHDWADEVGEEFVRALADGLRERGLRLDSDGAGFFVASEVAQ